MIKLSSIKPNPNNPRVIRDEKFTKLCNSLTEFPKMMELRPIVVDENRMILGGNMRLRALQHLEYKEVPDTWVKRADELTDDEKQRFIITDNAGFGEWDFDILANQFDAEELSNWGVDVPVFESETGDADDKGNVEPRGTLADRFIVPPFSVLNTVKGLWQERKRKWLALGIQSETGRKDDLRKGYQSLNNPKYGWSTSSNQICTSIFDPVLCEIMYRWFCPTNGSILDPFAGGSVRGIVANYLGYKYTGVDISGEQIEANRQQATEIIPVSIPNWIVGNSQDIDKHCKGMYDFVFSCPPYYDLEVYSDNPNDISNYKTYEAFINDYDAIIQKSVNMLNDDRFACFVVGDVRDKKGFYRDFVGDTIRAFRKAGMQLYNHLILVNSIGSKAIAVNNAFTHRKTISIHQNVLVFYKGDVKQIKNNYNEIEIADLEKWYDE